MFIGSIISYDDRLQRIRHLSVNCDVTENHPATGSRRHRSACISDIEIGNSDGWKFHGKFIFTRYRDRLVFLFFSAHGAIAQKEKKYGKIGERKI